MVPDMGTGVADASAGRGQVYHSMMNPLSTCVFRRAATLCAWIAALLCTAAAIGFGIPIEGFEHAQHPLAMLGSPGMPRAKAFGLLAFLVPGVLLVIATERLRGRLGPDATWRARIGVGVLQLSALGFAFQGAFPLDIADLEGSVSARHAMAWMAWWIGFAAGGLLLASGLRGRGDCGVLAAASVVASLAVLFFVLVAPELMPAGAMQRLAFASWFAWAIAMARVADAPLSRGAASFPGSRAKAGA